MNVSQLVGQASRFGFAVMRTEAGVSLKRKTPDAKLPDWLKGQLSANREAIIDWLDGRSQFDLPTDPGREDAVTETTVVPQFRPRA